MRSFFIIRSGIYMAPVHHILIGFHQKSSAIFNCHTISPVCLSISITQSSVCSSIELLPVRMLPPAFFFRRVVNPCFRQIGSKHTTEIVHIIRLYCLGIGIGWHGNIFFHVKSDHPIMEIYHILSVLRLR